MKICLIGNGYWGTIIYKNLVSMGFTQIDIFDLQMNNMDLINDTYDLYFLCTPFKTHFDILTKISQYQNKRIWCEKPMVETMVELDFIYENCEKNNNLLFIDWIYTLNPCVIRLKEIIKEKKMKQIILNRTNDGPIRYDCLSIHDLSSHDLSIVFFLFDFEEVNFTFNEFSINQSDRGSSINWLYIDDCQIIINSSWQHKYKNRASLFVTADDEIVVFDDIKKIVINDGVVEDFKDYPSPIVSAINNFLESNDFSQNKNITKKVTKTLENL